MTGVGVSTGEQDFIRFQHRCNFAVKEALRCPFTVPGMNENALPNRTLTRRSFLAGSAAVGLGAATVLTGPRASAAAPVITPLPAAPRVTSGADATVTDREVITATPTSLVFSWTTFKTPHTDHLYPNDRVASDGEVWLARADTKEPLRCVHRAYSKTGFHYVTIQGRKPNTRYRFECRSLGKKAEPGFWCTNIFNEPEVTGIVSTLAQPAGKFIHTVAVANDIHIGMEGAGITKQPWSEVMVASMLSDPQRPTLVLSHFPVTEEAALTNAGQRPFIYNKKDSLRLQQLFQKAPGVFFMAAGHTHRAHRDAPDLPGGPQFAQFCASTPFPGGFTLFDIYERGYTVTFHRTPTVQALAQTAFNRYDKSYGFYGEYTVSRMQDRCFTVKRDMSALA